MSLNRFQQRVTTAEELKTLIGEPGELLIRKQLSELDHHMQAFIAESPFLLLGTAAATAEDAVTVLLRSDPDRSDKGR